jgi:hypothetical protein
MIILSRGHNIKQIRTRQKYIILRFYDTGRRNKYD